MKFKTAIFDLDGTIADTLPLCIAAFKKSIEPLLGAKLSEEEIVATFRPSEEGTIRKLIPQHEVAGIKSYLEHYELLHYTCPAPFPGIIEILEILTSKGVQTAMVTGKGIHSTRLSLKRFSVEKYFEILETGLPNGPDKINGIRKVLARLNAGIDGTLYIGDSPSDVQYCKEAGVPIAAAAWATTADPEKLSSVSPEWLFYSIEEFRNWIVEHI